MGKNEEEWNSRVEPFLAARPDDMFRPKSYYSHLWRAHIDTGLASSHFVEELTCGGEARFSQRVWEMALGRHLTTCGYNVTSGKKGEPDFRFEVDGTRFWVEAISPEPGKDMPTGWTAWDTASLNSAGAVPNREMLLRYTHAILEKHRKGVGYRAKGIVRLEDGFVIAIDQSQINRFPDLNGISGYPLVVEAVFPIGPRAISVDLQSGKLGSASHTIEAEIRNRNNSPVSKTVFFDPTYSGITAVLACHAMGSSPAILTMKLVHNPLAKVPIAPGRFGDQSDEWQAIVVGQEDGGQQEWDIMKVFSAP